jgi:hypothetical protein
VIDAYLLQKDVEDKKKEARRRNEKQKETGRGRKKEKTGR